MGAINKEKTGKKVLRLDRSRTERAFDEKESLWDDEIGRMLILIEKHVLTLECLPGKAGRVENPLLSIGIFGTLGSGKTSLLETLVKQVNNHSKTLPSRLQNNIYSLPVIKPDVLAKDEHFLYKFLATALNEDREKRKWEDNQYRDSSILSELQQVFQEVSEYLQVINEKERPQEDDPLGVSLERLDRHESEMKLKEKMGEFISHLADNLSSKNNSVILMPVDDVDLSMKTLISAIGSCWRYIQHPRLVPVFTFSGRLAQEILRVYFESKLEIKNSDNSSKKLMEANTSLLLTENMAIQYLGKLFPVRNRIRLGPASARVLRSKYKSSDYEYKEDDGKNIEDQKRDELEVLELLKTVSILLFGHSCSPIVPTIQPPLRVVTLRRQIQIVDAMQATGIERFMKDVKKKNEEGKKIDQDVKNFKSWGKTFDLAAWSLINAHRDVLKEINLNLDDLYSWTPKGLRQVVLNGILNLELQERRKLLKQWRYPTENRRSQIISLLAANVFRPRMAGEEPTGDEADAIKYYDLKAKKEKMIEEDIFSFPVSKGIIWFLDLCIGFYLPQILAWNRPDNAYGKDLRINRISDIGWDLMSGPTHAVRETLKNKKVFASGILFLNPVDFYEKLEKGSDELKLLIDTWCFYGVKEGRPWAAVSLWRGISLLGNLLRIYESYKESLCENDIIEKNKIEENVKILLKKHFKSAFVIGNLPKGLPLKGKRRKVTFGKSEHVIEENDTLKNFIADLVSWLVLFNNSKKNRITPIKKEEKNGENEEANWEKCFIRRLHGDSIMSFFWQNLEQSYCKDNLIKWGGQSILMEWKKVLEEYWNKNEGHIKDLLSGCPIWTDYKDSEIYNNGTMEPWNFKFHWEEAKLNIKRETIEEFSVFEEPGIQQEEKKKSKAGEKRRKPGDKT